MSYDTSQIGPRERVSVTRENNCLNTFLNTRLTTLIAEVFPGARKMAGDKRKTSEDIVSKSCWARAISYPGVWTSHTSQTGCVSGFSPSRHSRVWTVCLSAGQNGARLIKMAREEIGLQPRSKVILRHAQQDFDTISSELFFASQEKPLSSG